MGNIYGGEMELRFDPSKGEEFWDDISRIPGYPENEVMPISSMLFESGAIYKIGEVLTAVGAKKLSSLIVVADETRMVRKGQDLKKELREFLQKEGWRVEVITLKADKLGQVHTDMTQIEFTKKFLT